MSQDESPSPPVRPDFRFHPLTWAGVLAGTAFIVLCRFDNTAIRWWLILPLAGASAALFLLRARTAAGLERRVCLAGFWVVLAVFLLRDVRLSQKLADLYDRMEGIKGKVRSFESFMNSTPR